MKRLFLHLVFVIGFLYVDAQEVVFFSEGTNNNFYDQGIVNVNELGESTFEHTYPPGGSPTKWNDKVPCSTTAYKGANALKFNYKSSANGNWKVRIHRNDWSTEYLADLDWISFYIYSETELPQTALPLIAVMTENGTSDLDSLAKYNTTVPASSWTQVKYPIDSFEGSFDLTQVKAIIFNQSESNNSSRLVSIDELTAFKNVEEVPKVEVFNVIGYDSHAELNWQMSLTDLTYKIYASYDDGSTYELRKETTESYYLDFVPDEGKNNTVIYRIVASTQGKDSEPTEQSVEIRDFSDEELMDMVQEYSFRYFWEGAHQASATSVERSNGNGRRTASGATGFQLMAMIVAHEREYRPKEDIKDRLLKILNFLETCDRHHGAWSHWYNSDTKKSVNFSPKDDGGDIVETSFVAQGLIALKHYFSGNDEKSIQIREKSDKLWKEIEWDWYASHWGNTLSWHWSPNYGFEKNSKVSGWNECMGTYIMAAASPTYPIEADVYQEGWARNGNMVKADRSYYGIDINLARDWGGPLFWIHYAHHGINPHGLKDEYADYWQEHVNTALVHYEYAKDNPLAYDNYSENCWGLTASDDPDGYTAHKPMDNDNGTVSPTAALASMPYTPEESIKALKYFYRERGSELFGKYGPYDAFNDTRDWVKKTYIGIDQGPIVIMIENHRTGLLWKNVMEDTDVQNGLNKLGFQYEVLTAANEIPVKEHFKVYPNPARQKFHIHVNRLSEGQTTDMELYSIDGKLVKTQTLENKQSAIDCSYLKNGLYIIHLINGERNFQGKLLIQN